MDPMKLAIETELEEDGRWIAEVPEIPGVLAYGQTREEAVERVQALSLRGAGTSRRDDVWRLTGGGHPAGSVACPPRLGGSNRAGRTGARGS
jgi:hypothetical protein